MSIAFRRRKRRFIIEICLNGRKIFALLFILYAYTCHQSASVFGYRDIGRNITRILDEFFNKGYDKRIRPNYGGPAVEVEITMYIISISSVSEDFTSDFYFRQAWNDPRLRFNPVPDIKELYVGAE
ncbi:GABA-gated chloride channel 3 subunit-like protein, partial [Dinothrombium tinctorium]